MIDERHNPEAIVNLAESLLSRQFDQAVRLVRDRVFSGFKSVVVRCRVESSGAGLPEALIVKKARSSSTRRSLWRLSKRADNATPAGGCLA
jgi:hypothetical protein